MNIDKSLLKEMSDFAISELRGSVKKPEEDHDSYIARCWIAGMIDVVAKYNIEFTWDGEKLNEYKSAAK